MSLIMPGGPEFNRFESNINATPSTTVPGTAINHGAVAHTKSAYTELIASTAFDAYLVVVTLCNNSVANGNSATLLDISIGAAAAETVIIPDLMAGFVGDLSVAFPRYYIFPLYIPAGSRVSARTQSVRTTGSVTCLIQLYGGPGDPDKWWYGQHVTAYGPNAATSAGVSITPGGSGAEGTAVSVGTTSAAHGCLVLGIQGISTDVAWAAQAYHFDVGIDTSSTSWLVQDAYYAVSTGNEQIGQGGPPWWPIFARIPSGTVIVVGAESSAASPDVLSCAVYGVS